MTWFMVSVESFILLVVLYNLYILYKKSQISLFIFYFFNFLTVKGDFSNEQRNFKEKNIDEINKYFDKQDRNLTDKDFTFLLHYFDEKNNGTKFQ